MGMPSFGRVRGNSTGGPGRRNSISSSAGSTSDWDDNNGNASPHHLYSTSHSPHLQPQQHPHYNPYMDPNSPHNGSYQIDVPNGYSTSPSNSPTFGASPSDPYGSSSPYQHPQASPYHYPSNGHSPHSGSGSPHSHHSNSPPESGFEMDIPSLPTLPNLSETTPTKGGKRATIA